MLKGIFNPYFFFLNMPLIMQLPFTIGMKQLATLTDLNMLKNRALVSQHYNEFFQHFLLKQYEKGGCACVCVCSCG